MIEFAEAVPVWPDGRSGEWNQLVGFYASWSGEAEWATGVVLRITGADYYRIWCNGEHAGYGPARTAHGYARVDEWPLDDFLGRGHNHLAIEVGYHGIDSYVFALQPAFLQAEVICRGKVIACTGNGFSARLLPQRIQKVERFSKQRPFAEAYRLTPKCNAWRLGQGVGDGVACAAGTQPVLLPRHVKRPAMSCMKPAAVREQGSIVRLSGELPSIRETRRDGVGVRVRGYRIEELELDMTAELNGLAFVPSRNDASMADAPPAERNRITEHGYCLYDFSIVRGGFLGVRLHCEQSTRVYLAFDEVKEREKGKRFALGVGAVALELSPGDHTFESLEPYTFRYLRVISTEQPVEVADVWMREYANPVAELPSPINDRELGDIFQAGRQTFRTNSIDLFTDCMSRERGGYPCDAWFTARAERALTGESRVERNFLENYFLVDSFASVPKGMVPHCYPSDRLGKGQYIPNWGLWLVLQLCDYCMRVDDRALQDLAGPRVEALFNWFAPHRNEQGLLEDIPGWVFVEWSAANEFTQAVNHPTNMLYARCLADAGNLYRRSEWVTQARETRAAIRRESWDGTWFADQSVRVDGILQRREGRTETCQYHALYFAVASIDSDRDFWQRLRDHWGPVSPGADGAGAHAGAGNGDAGLLPAGLLYGLMLRFDLLQMAGEWDRLVKEVRAVFGPMAKATGTLWEHTEPQSSLNHGFASCACEYVRNASLSG